MDQLAIPYIFMRGGTSRGPYFNAHDLPTDRDKLADVLMSVVGAGHPINIDGIGGGVAVTTKVAMLSPSKAPDADVDYFFAQVSVDEKQVDFKPSCGNILVGVGPAAIEMGLVPARNNETTVRIRAVNTETRVTAFVQTPGGVVAYDGEHSISGVPGTAAPISLGFSNIEGAVTGSLLPTGNTIDVIDGIEVSCVDAAMPIMIVRAKDFGLTGYESPAELDENRGFFDRLEALRLVAGQMMGMGDVAKSVTPKAAIVSSPRHGGTITARYFMPWRSHPSMAVTGGQCLVSAALIPGTVVHQLADVPNQNPAKCGIEHASGTLDLVMDYDLAAAGFKVNSASLVRTARKIAEGHVFVPARVWDGK